MALCNICNSLQVDETTNEPPEETNWPGPERLQTFDVGAPLQAWRKSAEGGCATCRLIWDALLYFHEGLVSELSGIVVDEDKPVHINLSGILGQTLLLELYPLPKGKHFPGLEFYTHHGTYRTQASVQLYLRLTVPYGYRLASILANHRYRGRDLTVSRP